MGTASGGGEGARREVQPLQGQDSARRVRLGGAASRLEPRGDEDSCFRRRNAVHAHARVWAHRALCDLGQAGCTPFTAGPHPTPNPPRCRSPSWTCAAGTPCPEWRRWCGTPGRGQAGWAATRHVTDRGGMAPAARCTQRPASHALALARSLPHPAAPRPPPHLCDGVRHDAGRLIGAHHCVRLARRRHAICAHWATGRAAHTAWSACGQSELSGAQRPAARKGAAPRP